MDDSGNTFGEGEGDAPVLSVLVEEAVGRAVTEGVPEPLEEGVPVSVSVADMEGRAVSEDDGVCVADTVRELVRELEASPA